MNVSLSHMLSSGRQEERSPFLYLIYKIRAKIVRVISWHQSFFGTIKPEERHSFLCWNKLELVFTGTWIALLQRWIDSWRSSILKGWEQNLRIIGCFLLLQLLMAFKVVWLRPQVRWLVHPDHEWVPVGDENPLANVKLGVVDQKRPLDVLLDHIPGPPKSKTTFNKFVADSFQPIVHSTWLVEPLHHVQPTQGSSQAWARKGSEVGKKKLKNWRDDPFQSLPVAYWDAAAAAAATWDG